MCLAGALSGCSVLSGDSKIDEGIVIAEKLKIRSSTAMVALDLAEVKRGDRLDILEQTQVKTPTRTEEWYKVQTKGKDPIVGWVEARYLVNRSVVDKTNQLYDQSKALPSQGVGRLKVQTRLREEPGGDVITLLSRGTTVEIVGRARTTVKPDRSDDDNGEEEEQEEPEARTILWYQVRLGEGEVLRAGWVGAQQVQLEVPDEILHLEGDGRRFTGWVLFDQVKDRRGQARNNYIGLMKSLSTEGPVDFTRVWVLTFSPALNRYTGAYIEDGLRGVLPVTVAENGRGFTLHELDENGKTVPIHYDAVRINPEKLSVRRVTPKLPRQPARRPARR